MAISNISNSLRSGVCTSTTRPTSPYEGQIIYETDTNRVLVWDNAAWVMIADTDAPPAVQLIKSQTVGSGVSSVAVNDVFSDEFETYQIVWTGGTMSVETALKMKLNNISSTNYYGALIYTSISSGNLATAVNNALTHWDYAGGGNPDSAGSNLFIHNPFQSKFKHIRNSSVTYGITISGAVGTYNGFTNVTTSCTGFSYVPYSGTMSGGTIRVYGFRS